MTGIQRAVYHALLPCAGAGSRAGTSLPKQYASVAGKAVVAHALDALAQVERLASTLVVLAPDDAAFEGHVALPIGSRVAVVRCGGSTRAETVANGLAALVAQGAAADDWVLVHDAARCLIRAEWVERLIDACRDDPVGGLLALPVADTLKAERDGRVAATLDRRATWQAQTPQMFRIGALRSALARAGPEVTDEAGAMEASGQMPLLVTGALENFKLTYPADFALAERLLKARR
ncbi:MAG TPA: 2-C-methyl-D-erythritol 4-phosphate cytidylyltransferase [Caldimonas sp.]